MIQWCLHITLIAYLLLEVTRCQKLCLYLQAQRMHRSVGFWNSSDIWMGTMLEDFHTTWKMQSDCCGMPVTVGLLRCCLSDASRLTNMSHCHVFAGFYPKYSITATDFLCPTTYSIVVKLEKALVLVSISCLIQPHPPFSPELLLLLCVASSPPLQRYLTLLARTLAGKNPFDGFTPSVPRGLKLDYGSQEFQALEAQGPCSLLVHAPFPQRSPCP